MGQSPPSRQSSPDLRDSDIEPVPPLIWPGEEQQSSDDSGSEENMAEGGRYGVYDSTMLDMADCGDGNSAAFWMGLFDDHFDTYFEYDNSEDEFIPSSGYEDTSEFDEEESLSGGEGEVEPLEGGYDLDFVDPPPEDLQCSICLSVLRDPHLTSCCGKHFCQGCIGRIRKSGKPCPLCMCKGYNFTIMLDKNFARKVNDLKVRCPKKEKGCEWTGELKNMEMHLDIAAGGCDFVTIPCDYSCGCVVLRRELQEHKANSCSKRPYKCDHCGHEAPYKDVIDEHYSRCQRFPIDCPNHCGISDIERGQLEKHTKEDCPLQEIECEYQFAGCSSKPPRKDMQQHLNENVSSHLLLITQDFQQKLSLKDNTISQLEATVTKQQEEIKSLRVRVDQRSEQSSDLVVSLTTAVHRLEKTVYGLPPVEFVMPDFLQHKANNNQWFSEPFYTHREGYKMCLSVFANGIGIGKNTHVSLFANLMRGEFDDKLTWPFRGNIVVRLVLHDEDIETTLRYTVRSPDKSSCRVFNSDKNSFGQGMVRFISHPELYPLPYSLRFRVSSVRVL